MSAKPRATVRRKLSLYQWGMRVRDHYMGNKAFSRTHAEQMDAAKRDLWTDLDSKTSRGKFRYDKFTRAYVRGFNAALWDVQWQDLEFVYRDPEGVTYSTHKTSERHASTEPLYQANRGSELGGWDRTHCWKHSGKPFGEWTNG